MVAAAALHYSGADYQYNTTLYGTGAIQDGALAGDLVLFGRGDPTISDRYAETRTAVFDPLADSLWASGVRRVKARTEYFAVASPARCAGTALREALGRGGIRIDDIVRSIAARGGGGE